MESKSIQSLPGHVAIIMDGNGRWAKSRGLPRIEGHRRGVEAVKRTLRAAGEMKIPHLTLYAFSVENWKRPADEVEALMKMLERFLKEQHKVLHERKIRLRALGRTHELPFTVQKELHKLVEETADYTEWNLNIALNYGSRTEVIDAAEKFARAVQQGEAKGEGNDWETFRQYLYAPDIPDPDLIIRTSGESRLSNFLMLQGAYAEIFVSPVLWPEFDKKSFAAAIEDYQSRERRFGQTGEQIRHPSLAVSNL